MRFGSLFAGIGGFDLGLERAGMECAWQVEIDEFCQKVLTKHWPDVPKYGDIRNVGKENLETVDLICGGFPCQPFSVAGKRKGTADDRHLWPEMLRVITELKPTWVIGENVPGIIPIFLDQALSDLEDQGYTCETVVFPACGFDAPHRRDRLFIMAYGKEIRRVHGIDEKQSTKENQYTQRESNSGNPYGYVENSGCKRRGGGDNEDVQRQVGPLQITRPSTGNQQRVLAYSSSKGLACPRTSRELQEAQRNSPTTIERRSSLGRYVGEKRWLPESSVGRVAHGVPNRVDRLRGLGNAVVPQVIEHIGRIIMEAENSLSLQ